MLFCSVGFGCLMFSGWLCLVALGLNLTFGGNVLWFVDYLVAFGVGWVGCVFVDFSCLPCWVFWFVNAFLGV